ncbi:hypothetical protein OKW40_000603 [Paraburkholderia sp. RAU6.4a]|uniref:hypothetical protein n=1 Tax=Paraburkholderia sp. RAU6.4a TaxID=2991067 RepID=UPI003D241B80
MSIGKRADKALAPFEQIPRQTRDRAPAFAERCANLREFAAQPRRTQQPDLDAAAVDEQDVRHRGWLQPAIDDRDEVDVGALVAKAFGDRAFEKHGARCPLFELGAERGPRFLPELGEHRISHQHG